MLFTTSLFTSCAVIKQESMVGAYKGATIYACASEKNLSLNSDGTFSLYWAHADYTGKWSLFNKKYILLEFDEMIDPVFYLRSCIISSEEMMIKIINPSKLKDDRNTILIRVD